MKLVHFPFKDPKQALGPTTLGAILPHLRDGLTHQQQSAENVSATSPDKKVYTMAIIGDIGGWWGVNREQLFKALLNVRDYEELHCFISSPGGSADDALTMFDLIRGLPIKTVCYCSGLVASAATILSAAFDEAYSSITSIHMVHKAWTRGGGNADDFRKLADVMDTWDGRIVDIYHAKTGLPKNLLSDLVKQESWLAPQEALDAGFVDGIVDSITFDFDVELLGEEDDSWFYWKASALDQEKQILRQRGFAPISNSAVQGWKTREAKAASSIQFFSPMKKLFALVLGLFATAQVEIRDGKFMKGSAELSEADLVKLLDPEELDKIQASIDLDATAKLVQAAVTQELEGIQAGVAALVQANWDKELPEGISNQITEKAEAAGKEAAEAQNQSVLASLKELKQLVAKGKIGPSNSSGGDNGKGPKNPAPQAGKKSPHGSSASFMTQLIEQGYITEDDAKKYQS